MSTETVIQKLRNIGTDSGYDFAAISAVVLEAADLLERARENFSKTSPRNLGCLAKAHADEPMFILLARDPNMPALVEEWAKLRLRDIEHDKIFDSPDEWQHYHSAMNLSEAAQAWHDAHPGASKSYTRTE